ncbi:hypothetical protein [Rhodopirellula europaea]|jgi:hypothetical protein|uniref:Uncharacterized protein n=1 Tax=Rhodopirellula europaea SH398 TaxID=1263868 RepID=M5SHP8_9BACT|nr:hypothetical protein [Rhodopirellula europaea]EMI27222.1 hypothetical protein RESH_02229 [Rhodopirellula europaea SH398]
MIQTKKRVRRMEESIKLIPQFGELALWASVVCVSFMLAFSLVDRHPPQ